MRRVKVFTPDVVLEAFGLSCILSREIWLFFFFFFFLNPPIEFRTAKAGPSDCEPARGWQ